MESYTCSLYLFTILGAADDKQVIKLLAIDTNLENNLMAADRMTCALALWWTMAALAILLPIVRCSPPTKKPTHALSRASAVVKISLLAAVLSSLTIQLKANVSRSLYSMPYLFLIWGLIFFPSVSFWTPTSQSLFMRLAVLLPRMICFSQALATVIYSFWTGGKARTVLWHPTVSLRTRSISSGMLV